jgi:homoserine dehydrogenase
MTAGHAEALRSGALRVAVLGAGTVGGGTVQVLRRNADEIRRRAGRDIRVTHVVDLDTVKARGLAGDGAEASADARAVVARDDVDVVVELIGGTGVAKEIVLAAIAAGKHVVTANKALLAVHGGAIFEAARRQGVVVAFEAAVAGGIPIIKALREGLTANRIEWVAGIVNGTTNFILPRCARPARTSPAPSPMRRPPATPRPTRRSTSRASTRRTRRR